MISSCKYSFVTPSQHDCLSIVKWHRRGGKNINIELKAPQWVSNVLAESTLNLILTIISHQVY